MTTMQPLGRAERGAVGAVAVATAVLGVLGFLNSFARVAHAAAPSFGWWAWTLPLGVDLGIAVFSALDIVLSRLDMRVRWLRLIPWSLTAATVYLNIAGETTVFGRVAHAVLPGLWVVAVEVAAHTIKTRTGMVSGTRMDRIRRSRWFLAPAATARLWRRMVLWEIRSYPDALDRERARLLALTDMQDTYGRFGWRWKAPRRTRALYRLGEHTTDAVTTAPAPPTDTATATATADVVNTSGEQSTNTTTAPVAVTTEGTREPAPRPVVNTPRRRSRKPSKPSPRASRADYLAAARAAITDDTPAAAVTALWVVDTTGCGRTTATSIAAELRGEMTNNDTDDGDRKAA